MILLKDNMQQNLNILLCTIVLLISNYELCTILISKIRFIKHDKI